MLNISTIYRTWAVVFLVVFSLFTIGLPIVVASCPMMMAAKTPACPLCASTSAARNVETVTRAIDTSCCRTIIAADRSTVEYERVSTPVPEVSVVLFTSPLCLEDFTSMNVVARSTDPAVPLVTADIPILVSSLLI